MADGSSLCPCSVLLGAALTQPLVLSWVLATSRRCQGSQKGGRCADWKDADGFYLFLLPSDASSALLLNSTSFPCTAPKGVAGKEVTGGEWGIQGFAFPC